MKSWISDRARARLDFTAVELILHRGAGDTALSVRISLIHQRFLIQCFFEGADFLLILLLFALQLPLIFAPHFRVFLVEASNLICVEIPLAVEDLVFQGCNSQVGSELLDSPSESRLLVIRLLQLPLQVSYEFQAAVKLFINRRCVIAEKRIALGGFDLEQIFVVEVEGLAVQVRWTDYLQALADLALEGADFFLQLIDNLSLVV